MSDDLTVISRTVHGNTVWVEFSNGSSNGFNLAELDALQADHHCASCDGHACDDAYCYECGREEMFAPSSNNNHKMSCSQGPSRQSRLTIPVNLEKDQK